ncbi:orc1/cdc6 family replication initiation protein [Natrinema sp. HArc-T2]|uniref:orc1/cdc6 family replication initiation protein n=1 Tax=Natrinema sp. HArc-T2 TaxID=3242701 RepID=UPI00359E0D48
MSDFSFEPTGRIFKEREALLEEWTPEKLVGRDQELQQYHAALQPVIEGETPSNIFLYGKSGVGKTAATRFLLYQLEKSAAGIDHLELHTVEVNCDGLNSSYQTAVALVNELRDPANQISNTGYPQASVYQFLFDEIDKLGGTVLIVLDEVDHIEDDSLLYKLPRARSNGDITNARLGVIGISNDLSFRNQLSSKVRSSLCEKEVSFSAYNATDLAKVLKQRESVAFHDGVLEEGVIEMCAAYGAKDSGDARQALDLLLESGDIARERNADHVAEEYVAQARERLQTDQVIEGIINYSYHGQLVLWALTLLQEQGKTPSRTREIREPYEMLCEREGNDPVSDRAVREYLAELETLGIIKSAEINRGKSGGKFKKHELNQSTSSVKAGLEELIGTTP